MRQFVGIILVAMPLFALEDFVIDTFALAWRVHMTDNLVAAFFANEAYYRVVHMGSVDNPDQRITQDVDSFTSSSTKVMNALVTKVFNVAAFARVLWTVSPTLVWVLCAYATLGTWMTTSVFGRRCAQHTLHLLSWARKNTPIA